MLYINSFQLRGPSYIKNHSIFGPSVFNIHPLADNKRKKEYVYVLKQYLFPTLNQRITVLFLGSMTFHLQVISQTNHFIKQSFH